MLYHSRRSPQLSSRHPASFVDLARGQNLKEAARSRLGLGGAASPRGNGGPPEDIAEEAHRAQDLARRHLNVLLGLEDPLSQLTQIALSPSYHDPYLAWELIKFSCREIGSPVNAEHLAGLALEIARILLHDENLARLAEDLQAWALIRRAQARSSLPALEFAAEDLERAREAAARGTGDADLAATLYLESGIFFFDLGCLSAARNLLEEAARAFGELGDGPMEALALLYQAVVAAQARRWPTKRFRRRIKGVLQDGAAAPDPLLFRSLCRAYRAEDYPELASLLRRARPTFELGQPDSQ